MRIFLSYAHVDSALREELMNSLAPLIEQRGLVVWYDKNLLAGDNLHAAIEQQLNDAELVLLLLSKDYLASANCCSEMERALVLRETRGTVVIPIIMRECDWKRNSLRELLAVPKDGKPVEAYRRRSSALQEVVEAIDKVVVSRQPQTVQYERQPVDRMRLAGTTTPENISPAPIFALPSFGRCLVGRDELIKRVARLLSTFSLAEDDSSHTFAFYGMPGLGKTSLARALAGHPVVASAFREHILWQSIGTRADALDIVTRWCDGLGVSGLVDKVPFSASAKLRSELAIKSFIRLRQHIAISNIPVLFIVDDVWHIKQLQPMATASPILITDSRCGTVLTTRNLTIAEYFAPLAYRENPPRLTEVDSARLLASLLSEHVIQTYSDECRQLLARLAGLPLAIHVAGHYLQRQYSRGYDMQLVLKTLYTESELLLTRPIPQDMQHQLHELEGNSSVLAVLQLSTDALDTRVRECFGMVGSGVPRNSGRFGLHWLQACWNVSETEANRIADQLVEAGLFEPVATVGGIRYFCMHDIIRSHAQQLRRQMLGDGQ